MASYYKSSNKFSLAGFPHFLAAVLLLVPLLSVIYSYLTWYIPIFYFNVIITLAFGGFTDYIINQVVKLGKVRNEVIAAIFGLMAGLFALYCQWVVWLDLVINAGEKFGTNDIGISISNISVNQTWALFQMPVTVWNLLKAVNEVGTWGFKGIPVSGWFLAIIWVIEAVIIVGLAVILPAIRAAHPFCEVDNQWAGETELPATNFIEDGAGLKDSLENDNPQILTALQKAENTGVNHSVLTVYECPGSALYYLTATNKTITHDKNGKPEVKDTQLVKYISIAPETAKTLLTMVNSPISV